ncbi:MAG: hypothetical protein J6S82_02905 [Bacteroidales bacterium]|nr:hypothetical protein [Bacteroidales bacterium]
MLFVKIPEREHRKFNYQPRYYHPATSDAEIEGLSEEERKAQAMRNRIHQGLEQQKKHQRVPLNRLWIFAFILFVLLLVMSRLPWP